MTLIGHFQNAYVTRDLNRAIDMCAPIMGASVFDVMDIELPLRLADGDSAISLRVATAWAGKVQIELIQPVSGHLAPYVGVLPSDDADFVPRFHHVAVRRDDLALLKEEILALGLPVMFETGGNGIVSYFVDASSRIGHPIEFVYASPESRGFLGWSDRAMTCNGG